MSELSTRALRLCFINEISLLQHYEMRKLEIKIVKFIILIYPVSVDILAKHIVFLESDLHTVVMYTLASPTLSYMRRV